MFSLPNLPSSLSISLSLSLFFFFFFVIILFSFRLHDNALGAAAGLVAMVVDVHLALWASGSESTAAR